MDEEEDEEEAWRQDLPFLQPGDADSRDTLQAKLHAALNLLKACILHSRQYPRLAHQLSPHHPPVCAGAASAPGAELAERGLQQRGTRAAARSSRRDGAAARAQQPAILRAHGLRGEAARAGVHAAAKALAAQWRQRSCTGRRARGAQHRCRRSVCRLRTSGSRTGSGRGGSGR